MSGKLQKWLFCFLLHSNRWHTWFYFITADILSNHLLKWYFLGFSTVKVLLVKRYCETLSSWSNEFNSFYGFIVSYFIQEVIIYCCDCYALCCCSDCLWFGQWDSFKLSSVFFWHILIIHFLLSFICVSSSFYFLSSPSFLLQTCCGLEH